MSATRREGSVLPKASILGLLSLLLAACGGTAGLPLTDVGPLSGDPSVSVALVSIQGSAVTVRISSTNFTAIAAAAATSPHKFKEGHYHLFLDAIPTAPGEVIPKTTGIFHTAESTFTIPNVSNGHHKLWVVLGYNDHTPYQHVDVVSSRPLGAIALLGFDVTGSNYTAPTAPSPSSTTAVAPSTAPSTASSAPSGGSATQIKVEFDATNQGKYVPDPSNAKVGTTITWLFDDDQGGPHTVTADDSSFDSQAKVTGNKGDKFTFTFTKAGTVTYHCNFHANMKGTITVG